MSAQALRVIGIGSPFGGDRAGWDVAAALRRRPPPGVALQCRVCRAPAAELAAQLRGAQAAVLIDALRDGGEPGTVSAWSTGALRRAGHASGHGLGVGEVLALLSALGEAPPQVIVLAVSVAGDGAALDATALERAVAAVRRQLLDIVRARSPVS